MSMIPTKHMCEHHNHMGTQVITVAAPKGIGKFNYILNVW